VARPHLLKKPEMRQEADRYRLIIVVYERIVARIRAMVYAQQRGDL
jgi:hypothetical protein